ncbi:MAG: exonuclease SbcCD subunit D [Chitinophagales bacterium]
MLEPTKMSAASIKILHTADWHLGKRLEKFSRFDEQRAVLAEICAIADAQQVDVVIVAGDIFDQYNPPNEAIDLFYKTVKKLSNDGNRLVLCIAGNHDSPERISAPEPLARTAGVCLLGLPDSYIPPFVLESGLALLRSEEGFLEFKLPKHNTPLRIIATPYANELRLKKFLNFNDDILLRAHLQTFWQNLADKYCDDKGVNLLVSHLFVIDEKDTNPPAEDDDKPILIAGNAQAIFTQNFPSEMQYVALGHMHRCYALSDNMPMVMYSGSPLQYSLSEAGQQKYVLVLQLTANEPPQIEKIPLSEGLPLVKKTFKQVDECVQWLNENPNCYVEIELVCAHYISAEETKQIFEAHDKIVRIIPHITAGAQATETSISAKLEQLDINEIFKEYFKSKTGKEADDTFLALFNEIRNMSEDL